MQNMLTLRLRKYAAELGVDLIGFAPVERFEGAPKKSHPNSLLPKARTVVGIALHYPDAVITVAGDRRILFPYQYFYHVINDRVDFIAYSLARLLESNGYAALPVPMHSHIYHPDWNAYENRFFSDFSNRHACVAAGIGDFGWNNLFITREFGPRVRISSVITEAPLESTPLITDRLCDNCHICVEKCPLGAISRDEKVTFKIGEKICEMGVLDKWKCQWADSGLLKATYCSEDILPPSEITPEAFREAVKKRDALADTTRSGHWCGRCMLFCPLGEKARQSRLKKVST